MCLSALVANQVYNLIASAYNHIPLRFFSVLKIHSQSTAGNQNTGHKLSKHVFVSCSENSSRAVHSLLLFYLVQVYIVIALILLQFPAEYKVFLWVGLCLSHGLELKLCKLISGSSLFI